MDVAEASEHTFLFADLAGFSALTEAHGDERAADLVGDFCSRVRTMLPEYGAQEVKAIGDALMLRSDDAAAAVELARRLVRDVGGRHGFPAIRVGVHTGPAVEREQDWFGATVNIASRVADIATADEVLLTRSTLDAVEGRIADLATSPRGSHRLRNVREPVEVFAADPRAGDTDAPLAIDPVCRMAIDPRIAPEAHEFRGMTFFFCSPACAEAFRGEPRQFAGPGSSKLELRVSDQSRERAVATLRRAYGRGRIGRDELEERSAHAYAARTRRELSVLLRDLPGYRRRRAAARWRRALRFMWPWRRRSTR